jgi:peptidoglycan/LPS O-acetylase OafA/YrhL
VLAPTGPELERRREPGTKEAPPPGSRLPYRPALDGVRALAVIAVFAYHADLGWARAGFLGVDVFFVLSGYLITALLVAERQAAGRVNLRRFWARRARRLLPAVVVLLAAVAVAVPLLVPEQAARLRGDLLAALAYVSNWRMIFGGESYFEAAGRPPVLQHLWTLAVEEQFYLLWPPVLVLLLRRRSPRRLVAPLVVAAAGSAALMAILHEPYADPSRVYFGTDTHASGLLLGAALAAGTAWWRDTHRLGVGPRAALEVGGLAAVAALAWAVYSVDEFDPGLYRGGFFAVAVASAVVVAAAGRPGRPGLLGRGLGSRPMVWLGRRSYAAYLWSWPVIMVTRPQLDVPFEGGPLLALRAVLTLALAAVSYRFVEEPARRGAIGRAWADLRQARADRRPVARSTAGWGLATCAALAIMAAGVAVSEDRGTGPEVVAATGLNAASAEKLLGDGTVGVVTTVAPTTGPEVTTTTVTAAEGPTTTPAPPPPTAAPTTAAPEPPRPPIELPTVRAQVTAIGDSVLLGAKPLLEHQVEGIVVDADVGRQFASVVATVRSHRDGGLLGQAVIVHTGNNGPIPPGQIDQLLGLLEGVGKVVLVNVKVHRAWEGPNNEVLAEAADRWPNTVLVDWHSVASANPDAFYDDGLHLTPTGIRLFTATLLAAI